MKFSILGVIFAAFMIPAAAQASILYTFGAGGDALPTHAMTVAGLTVQVSGYGPDYNALTNTGNVANINHHFNGWGIEGGTADNRIGLNEAMSFNWYPNDVMLLSGVMFERGGAPIELFDLYVDGVLMLNDFQILPDDPLSNLVSLDFSSYGLTGSLFTFVGQTPLVGPSSKQGFRIQQLVVNRVPEPSSLLITALGLLGVAITRHKRSHHKPGTGASAG